MAISMENIYGGLPKVPTEPLAPGKAKQFIVDSLRELNEILRKSAARFKGVLQVETPIRYDALLEWLEASNDGVKFYFSGRDTEDLETVGTGSADTVYNASELDYPLLFSRMRTHLSAHHPHLRYYGGIAFDLDHVDDQWKHFGVYRFTIPRFQLQVRQGKTYFACNLNGEELSNGRGGLEKLLAELEKLPFPSRKNCSPPHTIALSRRDCPSYEEWKKNLQRVVTEIKQGLYEKTVLARKVILQLPGSVKTETLAPQLLAHLKNLPSRRYDFLFEVEKGTAFLGSSPERLYKRKGNKILSEAVAGTRGRGGKDSHDLHLEKELMDSDKDRREHDFVLDSIKEELAPLCTELNVDEGKRVLKLSEGQHLVTYFEGTLKKAVTDEMIVSRLHPTPAVGGCPLDKALLAISQSEPFKRGWYTGVVGSVGVDDCDFAVGLRSGLVYEEKKNNVWNNYLALYSGVGVVAGSDPDTEWNEAEHKISNFMNVLIGEE